MEFLAALACILAVIALVRLSQLQARQRVLESQLRAQAKQLAEVQQALSQRPLSKRPAEQPTPEPPTAATAQPAPFSNFKGRRSSFEKATLAPPTALPKAINQPQAPTAPADLLAKAATTAPRLSTGTPFALLGALLVLVGMTFVLSQLARMGFFSPQMQWALAMLLAVGLYALAGRASKAVGEAMRGLGYGVAALCLGALSMRGVLAAGPVLGLALLLSLLVGAHARTRGSLVLLGVAVFGATLSTWLLADNLGLPYAQSSLVAVAGALLLCLRSPNVDALLLTPLLPLGVLGLLVTALAHGQLSSSAGPLWALYLTLVGGGLSAMQRPQQGGSTHPKPQALGALSLLFTGLLVTGVLTFLARQAGRSAALWEPAGLLLLALAAAAVALCIERAIQAKKEASTNSDPLREALLSVGLSAVTAWLALDLHLDSAMLPLRLLPAFVGLALYGGWTAQTGWRVAGAGVSACLLLALPDGGASWLVLFATLAAALRLGGRAGLLLGFGAAPTLLRLVGALWPTEMGALWPFVLSVSSTALAALLMALPLPARLKLSNEPLRAAGLGLGVLLPLLTLFNMAANAGALFGGSASPATLWPDLLSLSLPCAALIALSHTQGAATVLKVAWPAARTQIDRSLTLWRRGAEWLALLLWVLGLYLLDVPEAVRGTLLLAVALAWPLLRLQQSWPAPCGLLVMSLYLMTLQRSLSLTAPLEGLALLGCTLLGLGALFSQGGRALWSASWKQSDHAAAQWSQAHSPQVAALWGAGLSLLGMAGAALLAAAVGANGLLRPHALSATLGLLLPGLAALLAARQKQLPLLWAVGLGAFGLAACKLIAVDLEELGLSARGLGLTAVGLLLLGIGQLAPKGRE